MNINAQSKTEPDQVAFNEALGVYESTREAMNGVIGYLARLRMYCERQGEDVSTYHDPARIAHIDAEIIHDWKTLSPHDLDTARTARTKYHDYKRELQAALDV